MQQTNTIKKYDKYKDSGIEWIGEIPEEWKIIKIKYIANIYTGNSISDDEKDNYASEENSIPYIATKDIDAETNAINYSNGLYIPLENANFKIAPINSCLLCIEGGSAGKKIGFTNKNVCFVNKLSCFNSYEKFNNKLLYYILQSDEFLIDFNLKMTGLIGGVSQSAIKNILIANPLKLEQQAIAEYLDKKCGKIDEVVEVEKQVIEKLKEYKQSVITEAVTKGLDKTVPLKDTGIEWIGKIPQHWEVRKLKSLITKISDIDHYMPDSIDIGYPYLMTGDLKPFASQINYECCKQISKEDYSDLSAKIHPIEKDIIFARYATIGTLCYVDIEKEFLVSYSCLTIRPNKSILYGKYLYYYLQSDTFYIDINQYINSNTQSNIGLDSMNKAKFLKPSISEQQQIAEYLDKKCAEIDKAIADKEQVIEKLTEYKKSLIYECVTGKRKVVK